MHWVVFIKEERDMWLELGWWRRDRWAGVASTKAGREGSQGIDSRAGGEENQELQRRDFPYEMPDYGILLHNRTLQQRPLSS